MINTGNQDTVKTVLSIAGFDSIGGAGLQADSKTISALGCYAMNVITALPIQNTLGVRAVYPIPDQAVEDQLNCIFDDIYPDSIKIGMLPNPKQVEIVARFLEDYKGNIVIDPVMVSTSGHSLVDQETIAHSTELLYPMATLVTPNLDEASMLIGCKVSNVEEMNQSIDKLISMGMPAVLLKGGHLNSEKLSSILKIRGQEPEIFESERIASKNTRGTGCTLSSAIASFLALGDPLPIACKKALDYVYQSILAAKDISLGKGNGPLNHFFTR